MFPFTSSTNGKLSKPSLLRGRTTETSTTAALSHITDEEGSSSMYTISQFDDYHNDNDDFVVYSNSNIGEDDDEILDDADNDSIEELISATSRRWKQETAHLVRLTATGTQFPCSASALQDQRTHCLVPLPEEPHQQLQYYDIGPLSPLVHSIAPLHRPAAPPPVAVLSVPHPSIDDDDLTIDTAFMTPSSTRRPTHDDTLCFR